MKFFFAALLAWLNPGPAELTTATFNGISVGMAKSAAFQTLCKTPTNIRTFLLVLPTNRRIGSTRPPKSSDWQYFKTANWWGFRTASTTCPAGTKQAAVINILHERVVLIDVWCDPEKKSN